jgi:sec-independent protein translocase protein TatB
MFGLGFGEIIIIAIVALLLLGPDRLPEAAKTLGKGLREIRKATDDLKDQVEKEINLKELIEDKPAKPSLVPPVPVSAARPIPGPSGPPPAATSDNVPGLEVALAEPVTVAEDYSSPGATAELSPELAAEIAAAPVPAEPPTAPVAESQAAPAAASAEKAAVPEAAEPAPATPQGAKSA